MYLYGGLKKCLQWVRCQSNPVPVVPIYNLLPLEGHKSTTTGKPSSTSKMKELHPYNEKGTIMYCNLYTKYLPTEGSSSHRQGSFLSEITFQPHLKSLTMPIRFSCALHVIMLNGQNGCYSDRFREEEKNQLSLSQSLVRVAPRKFNFKLEQASAVLHTSYLLVPSFRRSPSNPSVKVNNPRTAQTGPVSKYYRIALYF